MTLVPRRVNTQVNYNGYTKRNRLFCLIFRLTLEDDADDYAESKNEAVLNFVENNDITTSKEFYIGDFELFDENNVSITKSSDLRVVKVISSFKYVVFYFFYNKSLAKSTQIFKNYIFSLKTLNESELLKEMFECGDLVVFCHPLKNSSATRDESKLMDYLINFPIKFYSCPEQ